MIVLPQQWHVGVLLNYQRLVFIRLRLFSSSLIRLPPTRLLSCFFPLHACVKTSISARQDVTRPVAQGDGWEKRAAQIDFDFIPNHSKCLVLMGADQSAVRSTAPGLEISSVIRAIRACRVHSLAGRRRGPRYFVSWAPAKAYGLHKRHGATRAIPSTSHERCRDPPTGVLSCHEHMLMQQDWGKEPLLQALYANRLLGLEKKTESISLWMENEWKLRKTWRFCGSWLQFALQSCYFFKCLRLLVMHNFSTFINFSHMLSFFQQLAWGIYTYLECLNQLITRLVFNTKLKNQLFSVHELETELNWSH